MSKISHLVKMLIMLQYKEITTATELSEILGVDKKTIYRYKNTLISSDIPVHTKKGRYGGIYIEKDFYLKTPKLTEEEFQSLIIASEVLTEHIEFPYEKELKSVVAKIKNTLIHTDREFSNILKIKDFNLNEVGDIKNLDYKIDKINSAIYRKNILSISYFSINKNNLTLRKVEPYTILFKNGFWYMLGYCHLKQKVLMFHISRIKDIKIIEDVFVKPSSVSIKSYIEKINMNCKKEVKIKFNNNISEFIKQVKWDETQKITNLNDGGIVFTIYVDELGDIKKWILGFGKDAKVISPDKLRHEIAKDIKSLNENYNL